MTRLPQVDWRGLLQRIGCLPFVAVAMIGASVFFFARANSGGMVEGFGYGMLAVGLLVAAMIAAAVTVTRLLGEGLGAFLFFPGRTEERPPPIYGIPETRRANGQYEEAMEGFARIAAEYPQEWKAYVLMIDTAVVNLRDAGRAEAVYRRGMDTLQREEDRATLTRFYEAIRSRLAEHPAPPPIALHPSSSSHSQSHSQSASQSSSQSL